jgi:hypothetical protein
MTAKAEKHAATMAATKAAEAAPTTEAEAAAAPAAANAKAKAVAFVGEAEARKAAARSAHTKRAAKAVKVGNGVPAHSVLNENQHQDEEDWELSENGPPKGSNLSGNKALLEDYPEDEAHSKKNKNTNTGKGKKSNPNTKK